MTTLSDILSGAIWVADTPGSLTRGALAGKPGKRLSGREMLQEWGALGQNREGLDAGDAAGLAADLVVDPLNWLGGALVTKGIKALSKGRKASAAATGLESALAPAEMAAVEAAMKPTAGLGGALGEAVDPLKAMPPTREAMPGLGGALGEAAMPPTAAPAVAAASEMVLPAKVAGAEVAKPAMAAVRPASAVNPGPVSEQHQFMLDVIDSVASDKDSLWNPDKLFISDVIASSGMKRDEAVKLLKEMREKGIINFSQVDLVESGTPLQRAKMETRIPYRGAEYNLIRIPKQGASVAEDAGSAAVKPVRAPRVKKAPRTPMGTRLENLLEGPGTPPASGGKKAARPPIDVRLEDLLKGPGATPVGSMVPKTATAAAKLQPWQTEVIERAKGTTASTELTLPEMFQAAKAKNPDLTIDEFKAGMVEMHDAGQLRLRDYTRAWADVIDDPLAIKHPREFNEKGGYGLKWYVRGAS